MDTSASLSTVLDLAARAYRGARPAACIELLRFNEAPAAKTLLARAYLRLGKADLAIAALPAADELESATSLLIGEVSMLRGAAHTRTYDFDAAAASLELARAHAFGSGCVELEAEYRYYDALRFYANGELAKADQEAELACHVDLSFGSWFGAPQPYFVALANSKARALLLRGLIAAGAERYRESVAFTRAAVREAEKAPDLDVWIYASFLSQLAISVRDFDLSGDAQYLRARMRGVQWPVELDLMRCHIARGLAWSDFSRGDFDAAIAGFRDAMRFAPSDAWRVLVSVDLARVSLEFGARDDAAAELEAARELADRTDWELAGEERIALVELAETLATFDRSRANALLERYKRIRSRISPVAVNAFDRRVRAYELRAEAAVLIANGERSAATLRYLDAFEIWDALGYSGLAARIAVELAALTETPFFATYARRESALRPSAALSRLIDLTLPELRAASDLAEPTAI